MDDVPIERVTPGGKRSLYEIFKQPLKDMEFRKLPVFGAAFNGAVQFLNSYFPYYFTNQVHLSLSLIALWIGISNLGCFASATIGD